MTKMNNGAADRLSLVAAEWGWESPSSAVLQIAQRSIELQALNASKHGDLSEADLAMLQGFPFYPDLALLIQHPSMPKPDVAKWLEKHGAALMLVEGRSPVVVFDSLQTLRDFKTEGRDHQTRNPVRVALGQQSPRAAMAPRDAISAKLKDLRSDTGGSEDSSVNLLWAEDAEVKQTDEGRELIRLLDHAVNVNATDISIEPAVDGSHILRVRCYGELAEPEDTKSVWHYELGTSAVRLLHVRSGANPSNERKRVPTDGRLTYRGKYGDAFLRLSFIPLNSLGDERPLQSVSIRLFGRTEHSPQLGMLNLHADTESALRMAAHRTEGLILVVGPTNSGKSTTIAGAIGANVERFGDTVKRLSVEDPVERKVAGVLQYNLPPEEQVRDDKSGGFTTMLTGILRHDPDMIWIGEVRDSASAEAAVTAAATGHLVMTSLHANNVMTGWDLLAQKVPASSRFQLVESLSVVVSQRMVAALCLSCRVGSEPTSEEMEEFESYMAFHGIEEASMPAKLYRRAHDPNCSHCKGAGLAGIVPLDEVLVFSRAVKDLAHRQLAGDVTARASIASHIKRTMQQSGLELLAEGRIPLAALII